MNSTKKLAESLDAIREALRESIVLPQKPLSLAQRMAAVGMEVKYIYKGCETTGGAKYRYVSHDMVSGALHDAIFKNGIVLKNSVCGTVEHFGNVPIVKTELEVTFINADDPSDTMTHSNFVYSKGFEEKACGCALSYAYKYILLKAFCLETGDDADYYKDQPTPPIPQSTTVSMPSEPTYTAEHFALLQKIKGEAASNPAMLERCLKYLNAKSGASCYNALSDMDKAPMAFLASLDDNIKKEKERGSACIK